MQMQKYRQNSVAIICDLPSSAVSTSWSTLLVHFLVAFLLLGTAFVFGVFLVIVIVIVIIIIIILFLVSVELQPVVIFEFLEGLDLRGEAEGLEALLERLVTMLEHVFFELSGW